MSEFPILSSTDIYSSVPSLAPVAASLIPDTNLLYDLGSNTSYYRNAYVNSDIYLGSTSRYLHDSGVLVELTASNYDISINTTGTGSTLIGSANKVDIASSGINTNIKGPLVAEETLTVTGVTTLAGPGVNTRIKGTLTVDENVSFNNLNVDGTLTTNHVNLNTNNSAISITGTNNFDVSVTNPVNINSTTSLDLGTTSDIPINIGNGGLSNPITLNNDVVASHDLTVDNHFATNGVSTWIGGTGVGNTTLVRSLLNVQKDATLDQSLTVSGSTDLQDTIVNSTFLVTGTSTSTIDVTGINSIQSESSIVIGTADTVPISIGRSGAVTTFNSRVVMDTNLTLNSGTFDVNADTVNLGKPTSNIIIDGTIDFINPMYVEAGITTNDNLLVEGTIIVNDQSTLNSGLTVNAGANNVDITTTGNITLSGGTNTINGITNTGNFSTAGSSTLTNRVTAPDDNIFGTLGNTNSILGSLSVGQNSTITGSCSVGTLLTVSNGLNLTGNLNVNSSTIDLVASDTIDIDSTNALSIDSATSISIGTDSAIPITVGAVGGTLNINSNATLSGVTTIVNSTVLSTQDTFVYLNEGESGAGVSAGLSGIQVERGTETNAVFQWNEITDRFEYGIDGYLTTLSSIPLGSHNINGGVYYDGTSLVSGTDFTWNQGTRSLTVNDLVMTGTTISSNSGDIILSPSNDLVINGDVDLTGGLLIPDNSSTALEIKEGSNVYMTFDTTNLSEKVTISKSLDINSTTTISNNLVVGSKLLTNPGQASIVISDSVTPRLLFEETSESVNERIWEIRVSGSDLLFLSEADNLSNTTALTIKRGSGATSEGLIIGNTTDDSTNVIMGVGGAHNVGLCVGEYISSQSLNNVFNAHSQTNNEAVSSFVHDASLSNQQYGIAIKLLGDPNNTSNYFINCVGASSSRFTVYSNGNVNASAGNFTQLTTDNVDINGNTISTTGNNLLTVNFGNNGGTESVTSSIYKEGDRMEYLGNNWHRFDTYNSNTSNAEENFFIGSFDSGRRGAGVTNGELFVFDLGTSGDVQMGPSSQLVNTSDNRLKTDLPYEDKYGLEEIKQINPVRYKMNNDPNDEVQIGFYAQDIENIIPEAVGNNTEWVVETDDAGRYKKNSDGSYVYKLDSNGEKIVRYKSFTSRPIIAALVEAVKTLSEEVDALKAQLNP